MVGNTKGSLFVNTRAFVVATYGEEGWRQVLDHLTQTDRAEVAAALGVGWYPTQRYGRLVRAVDEVHGEGDLSLAVKLGRFQAERDLTTIHRVFLRVIGPTMTVEKLIELWPRYHDTGVWEVERPRDGLVLGNLREWPAGDHGICRATGGFIGRCLELMGAKMSVVDHVRCAFQGDPCCGYQVRWGLKFAEPPSASGVRARPPARDESPSGAQASTSREAFAASVEALEKPDTNRRARTR